MNKTDFSDMNGTKTTREQAVRLGEAFLEKIGAEVYALSQERAGYMPVYENVPLEEQPKCYIDNYTRSIEGVPTTFRDDTWDVMLINESTMSKISSKQYAPFWPQENIELVITDTGVVSMDWDMRAEQLEVLNQNVALLLFEEIREIFQKQMLLEGIWTDNDSAIVARRVVITDAKLGMMQVCEKDSYDGLIMIPTWNFYGYEVYRFDAPQEGGYLLDENNEYVNGQQPGHSFLPINAIDGSIINPIVGY